MIIVPASFQQRHPFPYPPDNKSCFEEWFFDNYEGDTGDGEYLPIFWTGYYVRADFGQNEFLMDALQRYLNGLDSTKKYFTIIQYDGGILSNIDHLDIKVFSMSGGRTDYPLPLISTPHEFTFNFKRRPFLANFIGKITHPVRKKIVQLQRPGYYILTQKHKLSEYCSIIASSTFTLCPRGFGPTSFRIQEALQYGSIPVYISDEFVIPHNIPFEEYGVIVEAKDADRIDDILKSIPDKEVKRKQLCINDIYKTYFTYDGTTKTILQWNDNGKTTDCNK